MEVDTAWLATTAEDAVKSKLKAPRTAKFPWIWEYEFRKSKDQDNVYYVVGYVDSDNSFGAMLRSDFIAEIVYDPADKSYTATNVEIVAR
jgi:hypothetical protein